MDPGKLDREILEKQYEIIKCAKYKDFLNLQMIIQPYIINNDIEMLNSINILHWACYCGFTELVKKLIQMKCDIHREDSINSDTPIFYAIKNSNYEIVLLLLKHFGDILLIHRNRRRMSPFLTAISEFNEDKILEALYILELLYLNGASLEDFNEYGQTALFLSVKRNSISTLQWLLSKNINIHHKDFYDNTVLHIAVRYSDIDIIRLLCEYNCLSLVYYSSEENKNTNVFQLCIKNRYFLVYLLLKQWILQNKIFKNMKTCKTVYAFYFWFFAILNLIIFLNMRNSFQRVNKYIEMSYAWIGLWTVQQFLWILLYFKNPGFYKESNLLSKQKKKQTEFSSYIYDGSFRNNSEYEMNRIENNAYQLEKNYFVKNMYNYVPISMLKEEEEKKFYEQYRLSQINLDNQKMSIFPNLAKERISLMDPNYANAILHNQNPRKVCVTCNIIKPPRVHHCAICLHCIMHQDHHCVWVDNCIGIKNQRSFYIFILCVLILLIYNYYYSAMYFVMFHKTINFAFAILTVLCGFINLTLLVFITYLFFRNTRTILTNITFYEHYKKPNHITSKYNTELKCWDFQNLNFKQILKNIYYFWSLKYNESYLRQEKMPNDICYTLINEA